MRFPSLQMGKGCTVSDTLLRLESVSVSFLSGVRALADVTLSIHAGECVFLTGPSGSGKTTLLQLFRGLLGRHIPATVSGEIENKALREWGSVGLVFQNPETQVFFQTVEEELAFGAENLGLPPQRIRHEIEEILERLKISHLRGRNPASLSSGEKQRVAIGSVLIMHPSLLLLDEPLSWLDRGGREELTRILKALRGEGMTLVIADQVLDGLADLVDRLVVLDRGQLRSDLRLDAEDPVQVLAGLGLAQPSENRLELPNGRPGGPREPVLFMKDFTFRYSGGGGVHRISLTLESAEILGIQGDNGSGKTTLLRAAAGLLQAQEGEISVLGVQRSRPEKMLGRVALVMQNPERQLFEESAEAEVLFTLRRIRRSRSRKQDGPDLKNEVMEALRRLDLQAVRARNPLALSLGEQRRLVCACAMAPGPELLLLDEPTSGLDWPNRRLLINWVRDLRRERGTAVMVASHDEDLIETLCDRRLRVENGERVRDAQG